jgi:hypothetical protein
VHYIQKIPAQDAAGRGVILYKRKFALHPAFRLVPGLLQTLFIILYTFMFAVLYGTSIRAALERVLFMAFVLFMWRTISLWYASALKARHPKVLLHCEDGCHLEGMLQATEAHPSVLAPPLIPPLPTLPPLSI